MATTQIEKPRPRIPESRKAPLVAAAAFAAVLVIGLAAVLVFQSDSDTTQRTPLDSAESLHTAFNQGDFEAYQALFAPDAFVSVAIGWDFLEQIPPGPVPTVAPASFGLQLEAGCTEDGPTLVRCTWVQRGGIFERAGIEMTAGVALLFDEQGAIISLDAAMSSDFNPVAEFLPAFGSWLRDTHPDVFAATYDTFLPQPVVNDVIDTLESRAQWAEVLDEFLAQSDTYPLNG